METNRKHEHKACPRCGNGFTCKVGDVANCQCNAVKLNKEAYDFISKKYEDCLCSNCLAELNTRQLLFREKFGGNPH